MNSVTHQQTLLTHHDKNISHTAVIYDTTKLTKTLTVFQQDIKTSNYKSSQVLAQLMFFSKYDFYGFSTLLVHYEAQKQRVEKDKVTPLTHPECCFVAFFDCFHLT